VILKVVTYNVQFGIKASRIVANIQKLAQSGVNVFCLQEVKEFKNRPPLLGTILSSLGQKWSSASLVRTDSHDLGLATIWNADVFRELDSKRLLLPKLEKFSRSELTMRKLTLNFVETTLQRGALISTFRCGDKLIRICNLHLDCAGGFAQRAKQLRYVTEFLRSLSSVQLTVVCGDFNTIGFGPFIGRQEQALRSILGPEFINAYPKIIPTHKTFLQRLDYVFVTSSQVSKSEMAIMRGSDHFPIVADLKI